jgi:hypothetical protein
MGFSAVGCLDLSTFPVRRRGLMGVAFGPRRLHSTRKVRERLGIE